MLVRSCGEQAVSIMGQTSRSCLVSRCHCHTFLFRWKIPMLTCNMFTLDRPTYVRNRLSACCRGVPCASWEVFVSRCSSERRSSPVVGRCLARRRPGFNSRAGRRELLGVKTWLSTDCESLCLSDETLKAVGPFYLVSMPEEVKDPTQGVNV